MVSSAATPASTTPIWSTTTARSNRRRRRRKGYHLTPDLVDKAISFIGDSKQLAPDKPFFIYFATGAQHAPHQVPKEWADRYKGKFDDGWDAYREKVFARQKELGIIPKNTVLSRHDPDVQDWSKLPADERRLYARMMEVFAGFLEHTDHHIGRLIDYLAATGELDNTLIMLISDNGASSEGGPTGSTNENKFFNNVPDDLKQNLAALDDLGGPKYFNHYAWGWTFAGNTPFKRWKRETFRGGVSDPFLVHWPKGIKAKGEIRHQYAHAIDMVPTVLDALGVEPPARIRGVTQSPIEGVSFAHTFNEAKRTIEAPHPVFRDVRAPLDLSRRLACRVSVPRQIRSPKPRPSSARSRSPRTSCASSMPPGGSSTTSPTIRPKPRISRTRTAPS